MVVESPLRKSGEGGILELAGDRGSDEEGTQTSQVQLTGQVKSEMALDAETGYGNHGLTLTGENSLKCDDEGLLSIGREPTGVAGNSLNYLQPILECLA